MNTLQERIAELMQETGLKVSDIAKITGVSSPAVTQWKDGPTKSIKAGPATKLALSTGYNALWIATGEGPKRSVLVHHEEDPPADDTVLIAEYEVQFSGGNGNSVIEYEITEAEPATYRSTWIQRMHLNPMKLKRFKVKNDSMEPFLFDGDSVLVNLAENQLDQLLDGKIYAFRYGDELRIKQLYRHKISGDLTLRSFNPDYSDEVLNARQVADHIQLIGRVRDKSGAGGL